MTILLKRELQVLAVSAGALLFIAPLSYVAVIAGAHTIDGWIGIDPFSHGFASSLLPISAAVIGLLVASLAVDVQFHGFEAVGRGRRTVIGYAACWIVVLSGTIATIDFAIVMLGYGATAENGSFVTVTSVLVLLSIAGVAVRTAVAFRAGVRDRTSRAVE